MKIEITQEDIDQGQRHKPCLCPVALAVIRATGKREVYVHSSVIQILDISRLTGVKLQKSYRTSVEVNKFIVDFDYGQPVRPFTFELGVQAL